MLGFKIGFRLDDNSHGQVSHETRPAWPASILIANLIIIIDQYNERRWKNEGRIDIMTLIYMVYKGSKQETVYHIGALFSFWAAIISLDV